MDIQRVDAYKCGKCGVAYLIEGVAGDCCKPKICECGVEFEHKYYTACDECLEKKGANKEAERHERADKVTQWDGWVYWDGHGSNEGYFESIEDMKEYCHDREIDLPEYVYCCKSTKHELCIENAIEQMVDDAYEDAREYLVDADELFEFVEQWNEKQKIVSYYPDYSKVLLLG